MTIEEEIRYHLDMLYEIIRAMRDERVRILKRKGRFFPPVTQSELTELNEREVFLLEKLGRLRGDLLSLVAEIDDALLR